MDGRCLRLLVFALFVLGLAPVLAGDEGRPLRVVRLGLNEGLSQGTVTAVLQDRFGFLWIGTQDGLNRYDGERFEVFQHDPLNAMSLRSDLISALAEDEAGHLWVGTEGGGLSRLLSASGSFQHFRSHPEDPRSLPGETVLELIKARNGGLWVGTRNHGVARFEPVSETFESGWKLPDPRIRDLLEDGQGALWIAAAEGLYHLDPVSGKVTPFANPHAGPGSFEGETVRALLEDATGDLWVGTSGGLHRFDRDRETFTHFQHRPEDPSSLSSSQVRSLLEDQSGRLWVGTDDGLNLLDRETGRVTRYHHQPELPSSLGGDRVLAISEDRGGLLWIGTQSGLSVWNPRSWLFRQYWHDPARPESSLGANNVMAIAGAPGEDGTADDVLWIGTLGGGLDRLDRRTGSVGHFVHRPEDSTSLAEDRVTTLHVGRDATLWVGTLGGGLHRRLASGGGFQRYSHDPGRPESLALDAVACLLEDRSGVLWVGTFGGGLDRFEPETETFVHHRHAAEDPRSLADDRVLALAEEGPVMWVGTHAGLDRFDRQSGEIIHLNHDPSRADSLSSDLVQTLHRAADSNLWVGTQSGLNLMVRGDEVDVPSFRRYTERDGLPSDTIYGLESDLEGWLWIATSRGLSRFDPSTEAFVSFDRSDGLQSNELNLGAHYRSAAGELFFGGPGGFNAFFPSEIERSRVAPPMAWTRVTELGRPMVLEHPLMEIDELTFGPEVPVFGFEVAVLDFAAPARNQYRYKLEGFHDSWIDQGNRREVGFTNLDPGSYVLRVQGASSDGVWNEDGLRLGIRILPPFWRAWWFRSLAALLVGALILSVPLLRLRSERRRHRELAVSHVRLEEEVTRRRESEAAREQMIGELEGKNAELAVKNAEMERFAYLVSHDLKSPLITIRGFMGLFERSARSGDLEGMDREKMRIYAAVDTLNQALEDLVSLARAGRDLDMMEGVPLRALVNDALEALSGKIGERRAEVEVAASMPAVTGDWTRLLEVVQNLLDNALKFSPGTPRIRIAGRREAGAVVVSVQDQGIGIEKRFHQQIFEIFEQLDPCSEGSGVGLALAKRIIELHGGQIWVESGGDGAGSLFVFTLPIRHL